MKTGDRSRGPRVRIPSPPPTKCTFVSIGTILRRLRFSIKANRRGRGSNPSEARACPSLPDDTFATKCSPRSGARFESLPLRQQSAPLYQSARFFVGSGSQSKRIGGEGVRTLARRGLARACQMTPSLRSAHHGVVRASNPFPSATPRNPDVGSGLCARPLTASVPAFVASKAATTSGGDSNLLRGEGLPEPARRQLVTKSAELEAEPTSNPFPPPIPVYSP